MSGLQSLIARAVLGAIFAAVGIALALWKYPQTVSKERFNQLLVGGLAVVHLGLFGLVFVVLRIAPRGDLPAYYVPQADAVMGHLMIYRDFPSSYGPLHPYLDGMFLKVWHSPLMLILLVIVIELLTVPLWLRLARRFLPERVVRMAALLYLASPVSLQFVVIDGQNNMIIAALVALSLWMLLEKREFLSGAILGASVVLVKFLPLLYAPAYLICSPRKWRMVAGGSVVLAAVYGLFLYLRAPVLTPLTEEGSFRGAGNLGYVVEAVLGVALPGRLLDGFLLLVIAGILLLVWRQVGGLEMTARVRLLSFAMAALTLALLALSKKSWPPYLVLTLFPLCLTVAVGGAKWFRLRLVGFAVFEVVAVTEHSIWASIHGQYTSLELHQALLARDGSSLVFFVVELMLLGGYFWLLRESLGQVQAARLPVEAAAAG